MAIRLRIVGVFFDKTDLPFEAGATIKDVLDVAVIESRGALVYSSDRRFNAKSGGINETIKSFRHVLADPINPTLGGRTRASGTYEIEEEVSTVRGSPIVRAWQYYVIRKGKAVSNASDGDAVFDVSPVSPTQEPNKPGFTPFTSFAVQDKDEIIWRNVSIARRPQS
jgi:hypothetical protein